MNKVPEISDEQKIPAYINKKIRQEKAKEAPTFKEKAADLVAEFGGSWLFIGGFSAFFTGWILFNIYVHGYDHYPFILLNLILSCLAVFQAPFILMSQNRMAEIDRKRDELAYKVNIKAELEIQLLSSKIDSLSAKLDEMSIAKSTKKK